MGCSRLSSRPQRHRWLALQCGRQAWRVEGIRVVRQDVVRDRSEVSRILLNDCNTVYMCVCLVRIGRFVSSILANMLSMRLSWWSLDPSRGHPVSQPGAIYGPCTRVFKISMVRVMCFLTHAIGASRQPRPHNNTRYIMFVIS